MPGTEQVLNKCMIYKSMNKEVLLQSLLILHFLKIQMTD